VLLIVGVFFSVTIGDDTLEEIVFFKENVPVVCCHVNARIGFNLSCTVVNHLLKRGFVCISKLVLKSLCSVPVLT